jgi:hypothetical protein
MCPLLEAADFRGIAFATALPLPVAPFSGRLPQALSHDII